jgi:hypothetical protein
MIAGLVVLHIWALHVPGKNNPLGINVKEPAGHVPFHPYYTTKDSSASWCSSSSSPGSSSSSRTCSAIRTTTSRPTRW